MFSAIEQIRSQDEYRHLYELATTIRNQKLLTDAEMESLTRHKQEVSESSINLLTRAWQISCWNSIGRQLKNQSLDPTMACRLLKAINDTEALPAYKHCGHHFSHLAQLLTILYNEPLSVAELLSDADQNDITLNDTVIQTLFHMVYSCGLYPEDELRLAQVVCYLLKNQLLKYNDQMRTMLRKETSMSTRFYKHFVEQMHSSMVYLNKALRRSVLEVIQLGSFWLDIDSKQSSSRFLRDNNQNAERLPEYRALVVSKLVELVDNFLENIAQALPMLPPNLNWIVRDVYCSLCKKMSDPILIELNHACKDMIISNFICPAIISPQRFGVVDNDVRIGSIVNHNLVQIAMIIQMISLREYESPPEEYTEFLNQCRKTHIISEMMDSLLLEKPGPDVEIISLISNKEFQSDNAPKPHFVGSVADVNTIIRLISCPTSPEKKFKNKLLKVCKKLPTVLISNFPRQESEILQQTFTSRSAIQSIHRKVQLSFKRANNQAVDDLKSKITDTEILKKENFDLFFVDYSINNCSEADTESLIQGLSLINSANEIHVFDKEGTTTKMTSEPADLETSAFNEAEHPASVCTHSELQLRNQNEEKDCPQRVLDNEISEPSGPKRSFSKLKHLGDLMKRGISQSNTLADIRGHIRRSGSMINKDNEIISSHSEQTLCDTAQIPPDDILAKYASISSARTHAKSLTTVANPELPLKKELIEPYYSSDKIIECRAFQDTVRKILTVLGNVSYLPQIGYRRKNPQTEFENKKCLLDQFLDVVLVETEHRRDYGQAAQLREVKRCIELFDDNGIDLLMAHLKMKEDQQETGIVTMREERARLMRKTNDISSLEQKVLLNQRLTEEIIVDFLTKTFLETGFHTKSELGKTPEVTAVLKFYDEFKVLETHDERAEFLQNLLTFLKQRLLLNADWNYASDTMVLRAMTTIERYVMFSVYDAAFYPNKDLDQHKDKLLRMTIANFSCGVTHENYYLNIPTRLHGEAPWPSAQAELSMLDIYVTAQDKLNCIVRCCDVINNLIALSSKNAVASADDLTPVLVFVIIKANPRALLSNLQFVETFAGERIETGRDAYYWTIFKSAVEFMKTIL